MKYVADETNIVVSLKRGDNLVQSLAKLAHDVKLDCGTFTGIGAVTNATLGFYDINAKEYLKKIFPEIYELVSCIGNITLKEGEPFVHAHVAISGRDYRTYSGHLFEATIAVVGEFVLWPINADIRRTFDKGIGLAIWSLQECEKISA